MLQTQDGFHVNALFLKPNFLAMTLAASFSVVAVSPLLHASELDDRIESAAKNSYVFKTYLREDSIKTESKDGVVSLTGAVETAADRALAGDTVQGLPGVRSVNNRLTIRSQPPVEHSDAWIGTKVRATLLFHRNVSTRATDVAVLDGVVSLRGEASSQAQKELTAEYAGDVEGVKEVKNEMTVATKPVAPVQSTSESVDDASITALVKASLLSHRSTSAVKTQIETNDGVVTVSGNAKNAAEKSLVTKLITDIDGVKSVVNNMTIGVPVADR